MANTVLDVQGLTKTIGDLVLFSDISFSIPEHRHVGLIAKNGMGKTTLLNILAGDEDYDSGKIVFRTDLRVGYLPQFPEFAPELTVMEACFRHTGEIAHLLGKYEQCLQTAGNPGLAELTEQIDQADAWNLETKVKQILSMLHIEDFTALIGNMSGGQVKRVALAGILLMKPDLIILDEPTNHLDLAMIEWLEHFLQNSNMSMLMITHDRYFLDRVCSQILELDGQTLYSYQGNYAYYLDKRQERIDAHNSEIMRAANLYRRELDWMRRMPCARGHKAKYRENAFYQLEETAKQRIEQQSIKLDMKASYIGKKIMELDYISKSFGTNKIILKDFFYRFTRYEKMGIVGNNGTGKTTFIKMLLGLEKPDNGKISIGETLKFGYYSQEGMQFDTQMKVIDVVRNVAEYVDLGGGKKLTAGQLLQHFLFSPDRQYNYVYKLSGGERRRLYLCTILMRNPNFLILDEPTNDLDILTLQVLEEYLQRFHGCVIIVSHDRYFMDKVVDHLLVFKGNGEVKDFPGNYSQYREWCDAKEEEERIQRSQNKPILKEKNPTKVSSERKRRLSFKEKKELEQITEEINLLEDEKKQLIDALSSGTLSVNEITAKTKRLPLLETELEEKSTRWFELMEVES